ncbi:hypothetical protein BDV38DRAFT_282894 [Aspergillus pseudotamarii]|uniref:C2H2-type domain-containing protein n=1 Tax=Aspergillus pseudotamarii TaxID=132259 RepID=A0A5N6SSJ5_ASPPS|nr:uncharacterized protein BDV38DRAFT_282894 [Aspergillus pseudotamarii]KAE8137648.1 hypothetical protein BDV38DRAFT_282894 [Aspergillus pseudotamarii]
MDPYCSHCDRTFSSKEALKLHASININHAYWCTRCSRAFPSQTAKAAHIDRSTAHNICQRCIHQDFITEKDLQAHLQHNHHECQTCKQAFADTKALDDHVRSAHLSCDVCGQVFGDGNSLEMHKYSHQERALQCFGCSLAFGSYSSMIAHLESGSCACGITGDMVKAIALEFSTMQGHKMPDQASEKYLCPACAKKPGSLSALCQHAERAPGCRHLINGTGVLAQLMKFLKKSM